MNKAFRQVVRNRLNNHLSSAKRIRNNIAHGQVGYLPHGGKHYARITSPFFDPIKQGNPLSRGSLPGLGENELKLALVQINCLILCIDRMNDAVRAFHQFGPNTLPDTISRLEMNLQACENQ